MIKHGLIRRKIVCGEKTSIILNDQQILFKSEYELVNIKINKSKVDVLVKNRLVRRNVYFLRIGNKNYPSFLKASKQYNSGHLPQVINTCHISRIFLESINNNISDSISWNVCINNIIFKRNEVQTNIEINIPISTITIIDNSPVLSSKYPTLEYLSVVTSDLKKILFI